MLLGNDKKISVHTRTYLEFDDLNKRNSSGHFYNIKGEGKIKRFGFPLDVIFLICVLRNFIQRCRPFQGAFSIKCFLLLSSFLVL